MPPLPVLPDSALLDEPQPLDYEPGPAPADAPPADYPMRRPRRQWKMRTSDGIGAGTFGMASVSAYLIWSVVQGVDDLRVSVRALAEQQQLTAVTQERLSGAQREHHDRLLAYEAQTARGFADVDSRLVVLRRTDEEFARDLRDHDQRLRAIEADRSAQRRPGEQ